jgi:hypothetical protein
LSFIAVAAFFTRDALQPIVSRTITMKSIFALTCTWIIPRICFTSIYRYVTLQKCTV